MKKLQINSNDKINGSASTKDLSKFATAIADDLAEFLNLTSQLQNLNDLLDEYDLQDISNASDALYDFAQAYNHGV